jgi:hypothetical protein
LNTEFPKEETQMANEYMKKCSVSLAIRETQVETTISPQLEWLLILKKPGKHVEKGTLTMGTGGRFSQKTKNRTTTCNMILLSHFWVYIQKK